MRAVVQRVTRGEVVVENEKISSIQNGFVVLVGVSVDDDESDVLYIADKIANLRVFDDKDGKMNLSLKDIGGEVLLVSQFTLLGDVRKGRRPNFMMAAKPENALKYFNLLVEKIKDYEIPVKTGKFQAMMMLSLVNEGPVTILLDSKKVF